MFIDTLSNYFAPEQFFWNAIFPAEYILRAIRSHTILTRCLLVLCFMDLTSYESSAMSDSNFVLNLQRFTNLLKTTNLQRSLKVHKHPTIHAYLRNSNLQRFMNLRKFIKLWRLMIFKILNPGRSHGTVVDSHDLTTYPSRFKPPGDKVWLSGCVVLANQSRKTADRPTSPRKSLRQEEEEEEEEEANGFFDIYKSLKVINTFVMIFRFIQSFQRFI